MSDAQTQRLLEQMTRRMDEMEDRLAHLSVIQVPLADHLLGSSALSNFRMRMLSLLNNGTSQLFVDAGGSYPAFIVIMDSIDVSVAALYTRGAAHTAYVLFDTLSLYSVTAGTASKTNVYWSSGNSRYEIENKRGGTRAYSAFVFSQG